MPRSGRGRRVTISIPKDMRKISWKVIITSNGTERDVTSFFTRGTISRIATVGLSNFSIKIDNNEGRYKNVFSSGDTVDFYYDFTIKSSLSTIRFRGFLDRIYDSFTLDEGSVLLLEGRDSPKSSTNEHFADTHITIQSVQRNILDWWFGTTGTSDTQGNLPDGVLYNSKLILRIFDTSDSTWKNYKDLSAGQKTTLKALDDFDATHTETFVEKSRLTISKTLAVPGDYEFRIYYNSSDGKYYFMVHPEEAIINTIERVVAGQNLLGLDRLGEDTLEEFNRIKEKGVVDGDILTMRTKEDTGRQSSLWIKDKEETTESLTTDLELETKANARLTELKLSKTKGNLSCCALPTLQPSEKIPLIIPYISNEEFKVKSFDITFGEDIIFQLDLQDREIRFETIFKDQIDATVDITPTNNPFGLRNAIVFDFSDPQDYTLVDCQIVGDFLSLKPGKTTGTCILSFTADADVTEFQLRIKANQHWTCNYEIRNNSAASFQPIQLKDLVTFSLLGGDLELKIILNQSTTGVSPQFDKVNLLYT